MGRDLWADLSRFFGVELAATRSNATGVEGVIEGALSVPTEISPHTLELLEQRTAADAALYEHAVARRGGVSDAPAMRDAAFAQQLVSFGNVGGSSAAAVANQSKIVRALEADLATARAQTDEQLSLTEEQARTAESLREDVIGLRAQIANQQRAIEWLERDGWPLVAVRGRLRHELLRVRRRSGRASNRPPDSPS
jgi:hypothetical protein